MNTTKATKTKTLSLLAAATLIAAALPAQADPQWHGGRGSHGGSAAPAARVTMPAPVASQSSFRHVPAPVAATYRTALAYAPAAPAHRDRPRFYSYDRYERPVSVYRPAFVPLPVFVQRPVYVGQPYYAPAPVYYPQPSPAYYPEPAPAYYPEAAPAYY